eukprot:11645525-Karenia_brevis.AAC.1
MEDIQWFSYIRDPTARSLQSNVCAQQGGFGNRSGDLEAASAPLQGLSGNPSGDLEAASAPLQS